MNNKYDTKIKMLYYIGIGEKYILYSPLLNIVALVNKNALILVKQYFKKKQEQISNDIFDLVDIINKATLIKPQNITGTIKPEFLGIIPTRTCNSSCIYCDFGSLTASKKTLSLAKAVAAVDWFTKKTISLNRNQMEIHFFGGEPMNVFSVIETVVHRARLNASEYQLTPNFKIPTNGQYDKKYANFLADYFSSVFISIDGQEDMQNLHRPLKNNKDSFKQVFNTINIISNSNASLGLRACVSNYNIDKMEETASWFCKTFNPDIVNFEILQTTQQTQLKGLTSPNPFHFAINYIKSKKIIESYGVKAVYGSDISQTPAYTSCPVGKDAVIVSPEGRISSCYLLPERWQNVNLDLDIGSIENSKKLIIDRYKIQNIRKIIKNKPKCEKCFCRWTCAGGCHVGNTFPDSSPGYDHFCIQTRIISTCTLLAELGLDVEIDRLIQDKTILEKLALQTSDLLIDFQ